MMKIAKNLISLGWIVFIFGVALRLLRPESLSFVTPLVALFALLTLTKATFLYWLIRVYMRRILTKIAANPAVTRTGD